MYLLFARLNEVTGSGGCTPVSFNPWHRLNRLFPAGEELRRTGLAARQGPSAVLARTQTLGNNRACMTTEYGHAQIMKLQHQPQYSLEFLRNKEATRGVERGPQTIDAGTKRKTDKALCSFEEILH